MMGSSTWLSGVGCTRDQTRAHPTTGGWSPIRAAPYRELETKGLIVGRPGQGTFILATLSQVALPELAGLHKSLLGWLTTADAAGLDEDGMVALFASALRDFHERRSGSRIRGGAASGETEGVA